MGRRLFKTGWPRKMLGTTIKLQNGSLSFRIRYWSPRLRQWESTSWLRSRGLVQTVNVQRAVAAQGWCACTHSKNVNYDNFFAPAHIQLDLCWCLSRLAKSVETITAVQSVRSSSVICFLGDNSWIFTGISVVKRETPKGGRVCFYVPFDFFFILEMIWWWMPPAPQC